MKTFVPCAIAAIAFGAQPVSAQDTTNRVGIRYADLDLSTKAGRATLDRRIAGATEQVCGSYAGVRADDTAVIDKCRAEARRQVTAQLAAAGVEVRVAVR